LIKIEGESEQPIKGEYMGSLVVLAFEVKEGISGSLPIYVFNTDKDLLNVETSQGNLLGITHLGDSAEHLALENAIFMPDGTFKIPIRVSSAFNMRAFGLDLRYATDKMIFVGINRGELTEDFIAVRGNEMEQGIVRIGGYSISAIQKEGPGVLVELIFYMKEEGGELEVLKLVDDLKDFIVQPGKIKLDSKDE